MVLGHQRTRRAASRRASRLDSAVAKDKLFNYRMNLGYEHVPRGSTDSTFAMFNGGSFENIFGFGVYRSKLMRVWLGPSLRIAAGVLDESHSSPARCPAASST